MNKNKFALIWNNGKVCSGEDLAIANHFLKVKNLHLSLIRVNGQLFYSTKHNRSNSWQTKGSISDTYSATLSRRSISYLNLNSQLAATTQAMLRPQRLPTINRLHSLNLSHALKIIRLQAPFTRRIPTASSPSLTRYSSIPSATL